MTDDIICILEFLLFNFYNFKPQNPWRKLLFFESIPITLCLADPYLHWISVLGYNFLKKVDDSYEWIVTSNFSERIYESLKKISIPDNCIINQKSDIEYLKKEKLFFFSFILYIIYSFNTIFYINCHAIQQILIFLYLDDIDILDSMSGTFPPFFCIWICEASFHHMSLYYSNYKLYKLISYIYSKICFIKEKKIAKKNIQTIFDLIIFKFKNYKSNFITYIKNIL